MRQRRLVNIDLAPERGAVLLARLREPLDELQPHRIGQCPQHLHQPDGFSRRLCHLAFPGEVLLVSLGHGADLRAEIIKVEPVLTTGRGERRGHPALLSPPRQRSTGQPESMGGFARTQEPITSHAPDGTSGRPAWSARLAEMTEMSCFA